MSRQLHSHIAATLVAIVLVSCDAEDVASSVVTSGATSVSTGSASSTVSVSSTGSGSWSGAGGGGTGGAGGGGIGGSTGTSAASANVTVFVYGYDLEPVAGVPVVVNDAVGSVVTETLTGADGTALASVPAGGLVATYSLATSNEDRRMQAFVDPPDGSTISVYSFNDLPVPSAATQIHVTATGYPANAASIELRLCAWIQSTPAAPAGVTEVDITDALCLGASVRTIVAMAYDAAQKPIAWGAAAGVGVNPGATLPLAIAVDQLEFTALSATIEPIPAGSTYASLAVAGTVSANVPAMPISLAFAMFATPGPSISATMLVPFMDPAPGGVWLLSNSVVLPNKHQATMYETWTALPSASTFDPTALADTEALPVDLTDPAHPYFAWTTGAGMAGAAMWLSLDHGPSYDVFLDPEGPTSFRMPDVPPSLPQYATTGGSSTWKGTIGRIGQAGSVSWPEFYRFASPNDLVRASTLTGPIP